MDGLTTCPSVPVLERRGGVVPPRLVPAGVKPIVELSVHDHRLPLPLLFALRRVSEASAATPALHRVGPDHYRMTVLRDGEPSDWHLDMPSPGPKGRWMRDVDFVLTRRGDEQERHPMHAEQLAQALVALGWGVVRPDLSRVQLWEAADGLGDPHYVAPWAKGER